MYDKNRKCHAEEMTMYEYEPEYNVELQYEENFLDVFEDMLRDSVRTKISLLPEWVE